MPFNVFKLLHPGDRLGSALNLRHGADDPPFLAFLWLQNCDQGAISQQMFSFPTPASAAEKKRRNAAEGTQGADVWHSFV